MIKYIIIGGTGTLGSAILGSLYNGGRSDITVFSRDEVKQSQLRVKFPKTKFVIGDVRDFSRVRSACLGMTTCFHVAALKRVDDMERNPSESLKTNVLGTQNVAEACVEANVRYGVFCSTDKAVLPINVYGYSKALASKLWLATNTNQDVTQFSVFLWGNVIASRGSVIPEFIASLKNKGEVYITDERMTRFLINIDQATSFLLDEYRGASLKEPTIPRMKSASMLHVVEVLASLLNVKEYKIIKIGIRPGEKIHECLISSHEKCIRSDNADRYTSDELADLLAPIVEEST